MSLLKLQRILSGVLRPFSTVYAMLMAVRRRLWEKGIHNRLHPTCPCVSVGNISWGGTGKTPLVDWLLSQCDTAGLQAVVLTRGYKSKVKRPPVRVNRLHDPREVGDEPLMLAINHPNAMVLVDPNRRRAAAAALKALNPQVFILDDGFQHLPVDRHLDIVLLRPEDLDEQWNRVIPGGSWREGISALRRADVFCIKAEPKEFLALAPLIRERLSVFKRPVFSFSLRPTSLRRVDKQATGMPNDFGGRPYALVTGVGNPEQVLQSTTAFMGYAPDKHIPYPDHHPFDFSDARKLEKLGIPIVCTPKDEAKLGRLPLHPVWSLRVNLFFGPAMWTHETFPQWWANWYKMAAIALAQPSFIRPAPRFAPDVPWLDMKATAGMTKTLGKEAQRLAQRVRADVNTAAHPGLSSTAQPHTAAQAATARPVPDSVVSPFVAPTPDAPDPAQQAQSSHQQDLRQQDLRQGEPISWAVPPRPQLLPEPTTKSDSIKNKNIPPRPRTPSLPTK